MTIRMPFSKRGKKKQPESTKKAPRKRMDYQRVGLAAVTVLALTAIFSINVIPGQVDLKLSDVAEETVYAHKSVKYVDTTETELKKAQAEKLVSEQYDPIANAEDQAVGVLKTVFGKLRENKQRHANLSPLAIAKKTRNELVSFSQDTSITDKTFIELAKMSETQLRQTEEDALLLVSAAMTKGIKDNMADLRRARKELDEKVRGKIDDSQKADIVSEIAQFSLRPTLQYNQLRTDKLREDVRDGIPQVYKLIVPNEVVIAKGETVTPEHIEKFEALGLRHPRIDYLSVVSLLLFVALMVVLVTAYIYRYHYDIYANTKSLWFLALIVIASTLLLRLGGSMLGINLTGQQVGYLGIFWITTAAMLISVMLNQQISVVVVTCLAVTLSYLLNNDLQYAASSFFIALAGIYAVANIRDRNDLMRASALIAAVAVAVVWIMGGVTGDNYRDMLVGTVWAGAIGVFATMIFWIGTYTLEKPFGKTTHISLLELADTNKPLLRKLLMEAPGTYTHSVAVGHLAETAADKIAADSLLARVASYYHDIGKLRRPHFFVENQHVENIHDNINPTLSALVITSHCKDGLDIAKEYGLPKVITDVIAQHHGTSLVHYFFSQYSSEQDPSTAVEQQFRYPGPKPLTKVAAIVMLADACEAASRSIDKPTPAKIELMVNRVIAEKLRDGQLDESELTFREVSRITDSFVKSIVSIMHARIEYPDTAQENRKGGGQIANTDNGQPENTGGKAESAQPDKKSVAG